MAACDACGKRYFMRPLARRLDIPEYRAMTGFWPWLEQKVCEACLLEYDRSFLERLRLLAPMVLENDEPIVGKACLACGTLDPKGAWALASKWVDAGFAPARRARFYLCHPHRRLPLVEGLIVPTNLTDLEAMQAVLDELPAAGANLLERVEHWRPNTGEGPPGAEDFVADKRRDATAHEAFDFWQSSPGGLAAKSAWLGPIRKDYRLRYRLDLVREFETGIRESLVVVRLATDRFATYRATAQLVAK
jgi:hypothetical protein